MSTPENNERGVEQERIRQDVIHFGATVSKFMYGPFEGFDEPVQETESQNRRIAMVGRMTEVLRNTGNPSTWYVRFREPEESEHPTTTTIQIRDSQDNSVVDTFTYTADDEEGIVVGPDGITNPTSLSYMRLLREGILEVADELIATPFPTREEQLDPLISGFSGLRTAGSAMQEMVDEVQGNLSYYRQIRERRKKETRREPEEGDRGIDMSPQGAQSESFQDLRHRMVARMALRMSLQNTEIPENFRRILDNTDLGLLDKVKGLASKSNQQEGTVPGAVQQENDALKVRQDVIEGERDDVAQERDEIFETFQNYKHIVDTVASGDDIPQGDIESWDPATRQTIRRLLELRRSLADARKLQIDLAAAEQRERRLQTDLAAAELRRDQAEQQVRDRGNRPDFQTDLEADAERFHHAVDTLLRTGHVPADSLSALTPSDREKMEAIERKLLQQDSQIHGEHIALEQALELILRGEEVPEEMLQKLNGLDSDLLRQVRQRTQPESVPVERTMVDERKNVDRIDAQYILNAVRARNAGTFSGFRDDVARQEFITTVDRVFPGEGERLAKEMETSPAHSQELTSDNSLVEEKNREEVITETREKLEKNKRVTEALQALKEDNNTVPLSIRESNVAKAVIDLLHEDRSVDLDFCIDWILDQLPNSFNGPFVSVQTNIQMTEIASLINIIRREKSLKEQPNTHLIPEQERLKKLIKLLVQNS